MDADGLVVRIVRESPKLVLASPKWRTKRAVVSRGGLSPLPAAAAIERVRGSTFRGVQRRKASAPARNGNVPQSLGQQPEVLLTRARPTPDKGDLPKATIRFQWPGVDRGAFQNACVDCHLRMNVNPKSIGDHLHQCMQRRTHHGGFGAELGTVAGRERMILEAMAIFEQEQPVSRRLRSARSGARRAPPRVGRQQTGDPRTVPLARRHRKGRAAPGAHSRAGLDEARRTPPGWSLPEGTVSNSATPCGAAGALPVAGRGQSSE